MTKNKLAYILILMIFFSTSGSGQSEKQDSYVIITVVDSYKKSIHGPNSFYWIVPTDSIKKTDIVFYPLFLSGIAKNDVENCCSKKSIDPYFANPADSLRFLDKNAVLEIENLTNLLKINKKEIQRVSREYIVSQNKQTTIYYATPVVGFFCICDYAKTGEWRNGYAGKVVVPYTTFKFDKEFWKTEKAKTLAGEDLSKININLTF